MSDMCKQLVNRNVVIWLNELIKDRINSDLNLLLIEQPNPIWNISIRSDPSRFISLNFEKNLYKCGRQDELSFAEITIPEVFLTSKNKYIPAPGCQITSKSIIECYDSSIHVNYDILGLAYWMLCRCEEIKPDLNLLDKHSRFSYKFSHSYLYNYISRPIVDEWLIVLKNLLITLYPSLDIKSST